jgi:hypothetical protein
MLFSMKRTNRSRLLRIVGAGGLAMALGAGPFGVWVPSAEAVPDDEKTWVGDVERHGRHYDYVGPACAVEDSECPDYTVRYEIVPTSTQAARALPKVAGHEAELLGHRELIRKPRHSGTLMVSEVHSKRAPSGPLDRQP